jgi:hypothetical protein
MYSWDKRELKEVWAIVCLIPFLFSATVAFAQLPWIHPQFTGRISPAPCNLSDHSGQLTQWNPSDKAAIITLSPDGFTASYNPASTIVSLRAFPTVPGRHTGKWYFVAHLDSGSTTGWVIGAANGSMPLNHYPGGQDGNSLGMYAGNFVTQSTPPQGQSAPSGLGVWAIIYLDFDNNLAWGGVADSTCHVDATKWTGTGSTDGNPSTGFDGMNISQVNDGVSVMPAWGGLATPSFGLQQVTLYTNTQMIGSTLGAAKYWDQP